MSILWLEWINAFIIMLSISVLTIFGLLLWRDRAHFDDNYYKALISIFAYHVGVALWQSWYWSWGHFAKRDRSWIEGEPIFFLYTFVAVVCVGLLCKIRVFSEFRFGSRVWIWVLIGSLFGATALVSLPRP